MLFSNRLRHIVLGFIILGSSLPAFSYTSGWVHPWNEDSGSQCFPTRDAACTASGNTMSSSTVCWNGTVGNGSFGGCVLDCPAGQVRNEQGYCEDNTVDCSTEPNINRWWVEGDGSLPNKFFADNGCEYGPAPDDGNCGYNLAGDFYCLTPYRPTGSTGTAGAEPASDSPDPTGEGDPGDGNKSDDPPPETTTDTEAPVVETDTPSPGDVTTTNETTTTEDDPGGVSVTESTTEIEMKRDGDKITTTTTTTTTTTKPDGSTSITSQTDRTIQTTDGTTHILDRSTGSISTTTQSGGTQSGTATTTTNIGSDGSSTSTSTGSLPDGEEEGDDWTWQRGSEGEFSDLTPDLDQARIDLESAIVSVRGEAATFFDQVSTGAGALPSFSWQILGQNITVSLIDFEDELSIVAAFVLLLAAFLSVRIIMGN